MLEDFFEDQSCVAGGPWRDLINEAKQAFEGIPCVKQKYRVKISMPDLGLGGVCLEISVNGWTRRFRAEELVGRRKLTKEIWETFGCG